MPICDRLLVAMISGALLQSLAVGDVVAGTETIGGAGAGPVVVLDTDTGQYDVRVNGEVWLAGGCASFHSANTWFSNGEAEGGNGSSLTMSSVESVSGDDELGEYNELRVAWKLDGDRQIVTAVRSYEAIPAVVFEQAYPDGLADTATGDRNEAVTAFPSFAADGGKIPDLRYLTYHGCFAGCRSGVGLKGFPGGLDGGVPLALYDDDLNTLIMSPLDNFKVGIQAVRGERLSAGIEGEVERIPAGFSHRTILYAGRGINDTMYQWGRALLRASGKERAHPYADVGLSYLQYWTDNGAFYYYHSAEDKNYQQTLLDAKAYHDAEGIPFGSYQLDSWWYFKGNHLKEGTGGGVALWEARPGIFPDGIKGFQEKLGAPLTMHNRYWAPNTPYAERFPFIVENNGAHPKTREFWDYLLRWAKERGCETYEQDWLNVQFHRIDALRDDVFSARDWLRDMGAAAADNDMTIQYCMPLPSDLLMSTQIPAVTQVRVSGDYRPGNGNWRIARTAMLAWAVGLWPFKDCFWTTAHQPGQPRYNDEPWPERQALIANLSAGIVGPADKIGYTDRELLMKTCRADGLILKPDKPITPIDRMFTGDRPSARVWYTYSSKGDHRWYYVFVSEQNGPVELRAGDLDLSGDCVAYHYDTGERLRMAEGGEVSLPKKTEKPWEYWILAPVFDNGIAVIGDTGKFVTASNYRIPMVREEDGTILMKVHGVRGEMVSVVAMCPARPRRVAADGVEVGEGPGGWRYDADTQLLTVELTFGSDARIGLLVQ